ncbi:MAG: hypothetical protein IIA30_06005 [Myxococcales bacterium]|nr:hypothetical protein [Myxococcales bacterium]
MVRACLEAAGFNACGVLSIEAWDDRVPAAWRSGRMLDAALRATPVWSGPSTPQPRPWSSVIAPP